MGIVFFLALIHDHIKELKFKIIWYWNGSSCVLEIDLATLFYSFFFFITHKHVQIVAKKVENYNSKLSVCLGLFWRKWKHGHHPGPVTIHLTTLELHVWMCMKRGLLIPVKFLVVGLC